MNSTKKTTSGERLQSLETHWKPLEMITNPDLDLKTGEVRGEKQLAKSMEWGPSINLLYIQIIVVFVLILMEHHIFIVKIFFKKDIKMNLLLFKLILMKF